MTSRRTILLIFLWLLAIAIPTSFSKGRLFQTRRLEIENGIERKTDLDSWPIVFALTLAGGEPASIRRLALGGVLLTGICIDSLAFDFAPQSKTAQFVMPPTTECEAVVMREEEKQ